MGRVNVLEETASEMSVLGLGSVDSQAVPEGSLPAQTYFLEHKRVANAGKKACWRDVGPAQG